MKEFDKLSKEEQRIILNGLKGGNYKVKQVNHSFSSNFVKFGYFSDPHIGEKAFDWALWGRMVEIFKREKIKVIYSPGDIVEGMSGRKGQIYDLQAIGFKAQVELAAHALGLLDFAETYFILGNHDLFFKDKLGVDANIGEALQNKLDHVHYLGDWEYDVILGKNVVMKLFHANDGSAYATSYKIQKLIESLEGGKKPNIILSGHYHKAISLFTRNVFGFECGTMCGQTQWMRGKKIAAHKGFGIIQLYIAEKGGIERLQHEFFPSYD